MKFVLVIFILFAVQSLQASLYDICDDPAPTHTPHGDMDDRDCCALDPSESSISCDSTSCCGTITSAVVALGSATTSAVSATDSRQCMADTGALLSKFHSPPFRPPIG